LLLKKREIIKKFEQKTNELSPNLAINFQNQFNILQSTLLNEICSIIDKDFKNQCLSVDLPNHKSNNIIPLQV
jgi:hypothetical protein